MNFQTEIETLIRARYPILYVITSEEMRVQNLVVEIAAKRQKKVFEWTYSNGIVPAGTLDSVGKITPARCRRSQDFKAAVCKRDYPWLMRRECCSPDPRRSSQTSSG